jgi:hypothetical protein
MEKRKVLVGVGWGFLALTFLATPRSRRWEDVRPLHEEGRWHRGDDTGRSAGRQGIATLASLDALVPPSAQERTIFASLTPHARVASGTIVALEGLRGGFLRVYVRLPEGPLEIWIARLAGTNARPPVQVGPYALYPGPTDIPYPSLEPVLRAVAAGLATDPSLVPPGLRPLIVQEPSH